MIHHARSHNACVPITPEMRVELYRERLARKLQKLEIDHDDVQWRESRGAFMIHALNAFFRLRERGHN